MSKMRRQRRHLGMTLNQLFILGCLALIAIAAIFGTFIFLSSSGVPGSTPQQSTDVQGNPPQDQSLPGQGISPGAPVTIPAVISDSQVPENWETYTSTLIEISVPPQFEAVRAEIERQRQIEAYRAQGLVILADRLANETFDYRFWFNFPQPETVIYKTHIVVKADILPTMTLEEYIDEAYGAGLQGFQVLDRQEVLFDDLQGQRVLLGANINDTSINVAEYVITDEVNLWVISCGSISDEFYSWLPEFDRAAHSFRLLY
jgi:hypothetical protein